MRVRENVTDVTNVKRFTFRYTHNTHTHKTSAFTFLSSFVAK